MSVTSNTHLNSHTTQGNKLEPLDLPSSLDRWEIHHPCIPFYRRLFSPLTPKTVLKFNGRVLKHPSRFSVNLIVETKSGSDNAFHFNPRFDEHCVVCNSRYDKSWDEQLTFKPNPLQKNTNFCLEIFLTSDEYFVSVNRNHFCRFPHRIPFTEVNKIDVTGDVILFSVEQTKRDFYPPSAVSNNEHLHDKLIIPYMRAFLDPIIPSTVINIRGIIPEKAVRFRVDFLTGWTEGADIAFHFNPRFDDNFIACNSKHDGKWATEEPNGFLQLPFKRGHSFSLDVFAAENEFRVSLCGKFLFKFMYRISISKIKLLSINGDIELRSVNFTSAASPVKCKETQSFVFDNLNSYSIMVLCATSMKLKGLM